MAERRERGPITWNEFERDAWRMVCEAEIAIQKVAKEGPICPRCFVERLVLHLQNRLEDGDIIHRGRDG